MGPDGTYPVRESPTMLSRRAMPLHVGAVASAVSWAYPKSAPVAWGLGGLIAATRIVILAHWTTDVLAGLAIGALVERCVRPRLESSTSEEGVPANVSRTNPSPRTTGSSERASFRKILPSSSNRSPGSTL